MDRNNLHIAILGTRGMPNNYGGFEVCAEEISQRLVKKGHTVSVYCEHSHPLKDKEWKGVHRILKYNPEKQLGTFGQFIYDFICNLHVRKTKPDIVLRLGYTSDSIFHRMWSKQSKQIVNMDGMEWLRTKYNKPVRRFLKWAEKKAAQQADHMIADSIPMQEYLENTYGKPATFIAYGANVPTKNHKELLANYKLEAGKYDLVIARMIKDNNIEMAIKAKIKSGSDIPLYIVGNRTKHRTYLIYKYYDHKNIRYEPAVFNEDIVNAFRLNCRYYIHGHSKGGTNPSLLEAMACDCRILAHGNAYNKAVTQENAAYFENEQDLARLLQSEPGQLIPEIKLATNKEQLEKIYNWDNIAIAYETLFHEMVSQP